MELFLSLIFRNLFLKGGYRLVWGFRGDGCSELATPKSHIDRTDLFAPTFSPAPAPAIVGEINIA